MLDNTTLSTEELELVDGGNGYNGPCFVYVIKSGDCLSVIAKRYSTTVETIMSINPKITDRNKIYAGDSILIPFKG